MFKKLFNPFFKDAGKEEYADMAIDVLSRTLWGEARAECMTGIEAVAGVVLNRVAIAQARGGYWWGSDIISVCQKPYQFSCWNRSDPNYKKLIAADEANTEFVLCREIARRAVAGILPDKSAGATHYHADYVSPYWAKGQKPVVTIGRHIFYKLVD